MFLTDTVRYNTVASDTPLEFEYRTNATSASGGAPDGTGHWAVRLYNGVGSALTIGRPYVVQFTGAEATVAQVATPAALAVYQFVVIALEATAAASFGWFAIQGAVDALVDGTTDVADLDYLDCTPGTSAVALIKDHATDRSTASVARAMAGQTANSAVLTRVYLLGERVLVP